MARRGQGEGSIYQRKDGRWVASLTLDSGKRKTYYGKTRKEVWEKLQKAINEQQQGKLITSPQQTMKQYLEHWFETVEKPTIRVSTVVSYRSLLDKHILPALGHIQLQKLTPQHVQTLYATSLNEGFSPRTIKIMQAILHKALKNAVRWKLISYNVCDDVSLPRRMKHEVQPLSREQAQKLLEVARGHRLETLLTVALATGMRRGELLGLRWSDIDFTNGSLHIRRTMNYLSGYGYVESEPKTSTGRRKVVLPQFALEALRKHKAEQDEARRKKGTTWHEHNLVFCNTTGGFQDTRYLGKIFHNLLKEAELPNIRFHDLRHSAATILLSMDVHPKVVQELLGHSNISVTLDIYSHILPSMQQEAMNRLDNLFGGSKKEMRDTQ